MKKAGWMGWVLMGCLGVMAVAYRGEQTPVKGEIRVLAKKGTYQVTAGLKEGALHALNPAGEKDTGYLRLADRAHPVSEEMGCTSVRGMVGSFLPVEGDMDLLPEVIYALCDMKMDYPLEEGVLLIRGHVGEAAQNAWQTEAAERYRKVGRSTAEAQMRVPAGGESEHQLGLAVDVKLTGTLHMGQKDPLLRNAAGQWLAQHLADYGFVYSPGFSGCEEMHLRYVGKRHARVMDVLGADVAEYGRLLEREGALTLWKEGVAVACVQWAESGETISVPEGTETEVSRDNAGHFIIYTGLE